MTTETPIREYQQAVYIYWLGRELGTVKIGHTNNPDRRLREFANETGTPGHRASFAAVVWLDRRREEIELAVHRRLADKRRDGEWFALTPEQALEAILLEVVERGIRHEVEDFADITGALSRAAEQQAAEQRAAAQEHHRRVQLIQVQQAASEAEAAANKQREFAEAAEADRIEAEVALVRINIEKDRAAAANVAAREGVLEMARVRAKIAEETRHLKIVWVGVAAVVCSAVVAYNIINHEPLSADKQVQEHIATLESTLAESQKRESRLATEVGALKVVHENQRKIIDQQGATITSLNARQPKVVTVVKHVAQPPKVVTVAAATVSAEVKGDREARIADAQAAVDRAFELCKQLDPVMAKNGFCFGGAGQALDNAKNKLAAAWNSK